MTSKKFWLSRVGGVFDKIESHTTRYEVTTLGKKLIVLPGVFSPQYFTDSEWFAKEVPKIVGKKSMLEVGVGTGIIALFAALKGARVDGTDINPAAVRNTKLNFKKYKIPGSVWRGDVFEHVPKNKKYDFIFWNHPFNYAPKKPANMLRRSGLDYKYEGLQKFFAGAKKHLNPGGTVLLGTGNIARIREIQRLANKHGYVCKLLKKKDIPFARGDSVQIDLRIYSCTIKG